MCEPRELTTLLDDRTRQYAKARDLADEDKQCFVHRMQNTSFWLQLL